MNAPSATDETPTAAAKPSPARDGSSPGRVVRAAREAAGLSLEALAAQTRLARGTLDALERDDFGTLNEPVYVKGYYRKCAKVLALSETELIAAYERLVGPKAPTAPTKLLLAGDRGLAKGGSGGGSWRWLWILVIAALIGGGAYWLRSNTAAGVAQKTSSTEPAPATLLPSAPPPVAEDPRPVAPSPSESTSAAPPPPTAATEPAPTPTPAAPTAQSATSPTSLAAASSDGALALAFRGTSWVRVEDADSKLLLSGVIQAGDRQVLHGKTPYSVFLGNAPGVTVDYDGKPFDVGSFTKQNATARFNVPQ